jgi:hypothetical protein
MTERFDCHHCNESLFGKKYILKEEDPHCVACFEELYANTCEECGKPIGCDCKVAACCSPTPRPSLLPKNKNQRILCMLCGPVS